MQKVFKRGKANRAWTVFIAVALILVSIASCAITNNPFEEGIDIIPDGYGLLEVSIPETRGWTVSQYTVTATKSGETPVIEVTTETNVTMTLKLGTWSINVEGTDSDGNLIYQGVAAATVTESGTSVTVGLLRRAGNLKINVEPLGTYQVQPGKPGYIENIKLTASKTGFASIVKNVNNFDSDVFFAGLAQGDWIINIEGQASNINPDDYSPESGYTTYVSGIFTETIVASQLVTVIDTLDTQNKVTPVLFSHSSGSYSSAIDVVLTCDTAGATILYSTDGSTPSIAYTGAVSIGLGDDVTLKAVAQHSQILSPSIESSRNYVIDQDVTSTPQLSPVGGTYSANQSVTITCADAGAVIYFTTDGSEPTTASTVYSGPIPVNGDGTVMTIKSSAKASLKQISSVASETYTIQYPKVVTPSISPASGTYPESQLLTIECGTPGAVIYYTLDDSTPTTSSSVYAGPIAPGIGNWTVKTMATAAGFSSSDIQTEVYTILQDDPTMIVFTQAEIIVIGDHWTDFAIDAGINWFGIETSTAGNYSIEWETGFNGVVTVFENDLETEVPLAGTGDARTTDLGTGRYFIKVNSIYDISDFTIRVLFNGGSSTTTTTASSTTVTQQTSTSTTTTTIDNGISIYLEKPAPWGTPWIWYDKDSDDVWETTALATPPGDMTNYRTGWFKKDIADTSSVTFLFNDGTWANKVDDGGSDFVTTEDIWVTADGSTYNYDPEGPQPPNAYASPAGGNFSTATVTVTLYASGESLTTRRYTLDGSDPILGGISYSDGQTITIGGDMNTGDSKTLRVYCTDGTLQDSETYTFNKTEEIIRDNVMQLGALYSPSETTFRIWSPDTSNVVLNLDGTDHTCSPIADWDGYTNVYGVTVSGDHKNKPYNFKINGTAVRDPYGLMCSGSSNTNYVVDLNATEPTGGWHGAPTLVEREDAVIYEVHVRDFTLDGSSGVTAGKRGKFAGMTETGSTYNGYTTGIDHLKELGVTHVQILPFYDFNTPQYNWGYDPRNFNVPEEQYASDPNDWEGRIREVKEMINEFHKNDIRVIMDVVYNHTYADDMFDVITPQYFDGLNLSGCGNSVDSGKPMVSRFIQDSLEYWATEYNIDGFRFDLIGIFYYDEVRKWGEHVNGKLPDRNILWYGEPWNGYASDPNESQKFRLGKVPAVASAHVGAFNGKYREAIKGDNDGTGRGYMFNTLPGWVDQIKVGMRGSITAFKSTDILSDDWDSMFAYDPEQSINYISAHDNYCLWDKILHCGESGAYAERINRFGMGIVFTSQGIPFMHAGDEMLRTKVHNGDWTYAHNSYNAPDDYNKIRWNWKQDNHGVYLYYKYMIEMRNNHPGFRMNTWDEINNNITSWTANGGQVVVSDINAAANGDSWNRIIVVYNSGSNYEYTLPAGTWYLEASGIDANVGGIAVSGTVTCEGTSVTVLRQ
jgi:pullulanase